MRWWERVGAWDETHRFAIDATAATLLTLMVAPLNALGGQGYSDFASWWAVALVVPLAWRRTRPAPSAAAVFTVALLHFAAGDFIYAADVAVLLALYSVTVHGPVWAYRTAITGALVGSFLLGAAMLLTEETSVEGSVFATFAIGLMSLSVFAFALVRRSRRERIDSLVDRARRLEIERDQQALIATSAERTRIAREMHDIVAHSLSVIIAQADGGRYAADQDPAAATRSLTTIAETGRAALADMRRLLGVLRPEAIAAGAASGVPPGPSGARPTASAAATTGPVDLIPQPAVDDIEHLVEQMRGSGVRTSFVRMGTPRPLPPGTGLTVYRICQESLTNVLKHAGPSPTATVMLQWAPASLVLEINDDGRGAAAVGDGAGQGVLGMRERAAMLGGSLTVGPRPGGGYRVRAEIPLPRTEEDR